MPGPGINMSAPNVVFSMVQNNLSFILLPMVKPLAVLFGTLSFCELPNIKSLVSVETPTVFSTSIDCQFISSTLAKFFLGGTILVINALSSFMNASFLNPSDSNAFDPKLELELVIDISPPATAL